MGSIRRTLLGAALPVAGLLAASATPAAAAPASLAGEIVVTAQRRAERLQDVPIAVTALDTHDLTSQRIDAGPDLFRAAPNVTFSKRNFTDYNFQIRGIGSKAIGASGDPGVSVHLNGAPLIVNRLFEAEFYDVERIEVLRGPQGTLYGRNATGGAVNMITVQPVLGEYHGAIRAEAGDYDARRLRGMLNLPLGETAALRLAGTVLKRDGFGRNLTLGDRTDDRDLNALRATLAWRPTPQLRLRGYYERFREDDRRARVGKQLCAKDLGPTSVGGVAVLNPLARALEGQGCRNVSIYDPAALGAVNSMVTLAGAFGLLNGVMAQDAFAGKVQSPDLRDLESPADPIYRAREDVFQLAADADLAEHLTLSLTGSWSKDRYFTYQDYNRVAVTVPFTVPAQLATLFPGGVFTDPQVGASDRLRAFDISSARSHSASYEARLVSDTGGRFDFSLGALHLRHDTTVDYFVLSNILTLSALTGVPIAGRYVDPAFPPTGEGHNYFLTRTPYRLRSYAAFGELYWRFTDTLKLTAGARYNHDDKRQQVLPAQLAEPGRGYPAQAQFISSPFKAATGRLGLDWRPDLAFTDRTLVYGFVSRGYKPGGFNPPCSAAINCPPATYEAEYVNAVEAGAKNTLAGGRLALNLAAFRYAYEGYQVSRTVNRTSVADNIDADIKGLEIEAVWTPVSALRLNATLGLLDTSIDGGSSIDTMNRTQGDPSLATLSGALVGGSCVVPARQLAAFNAVANANVAAARLLLTACGGAMRTGSTVASGNPLAPLGVFLDPQEGVPVALRGKRLPNAPRATFAFGAQYGFAVGGGWQAVVRADYYRRASSFSRIYNGPADFIRGYDNINLWVRLSRPDLGLAVEAYVKNLTDETAITDIALADESSGLFRNVFVTEPRTFGVALTAAF